MAQPKNFSNARNDEITFHEVDVRFNKVVLRPKAREVDAYFNMGLNLTLGLPADFKVYHLNFWYVSALTHHDLDYIVTWQNAASIIIDDGAGAALGLLQRIGAMQAMDSLSFLKLQINEHSMGQMELGPFFRNIPSLKRIEFTFERIIPEQVVRKFLDEQDIPSEFLKVDSPNYFHAFYTKMMWLRRLNEFFVAQYRIWPAKMYRIIVDFEGRAWLVFWRKPNIWK